MPSPLRALGAAALALLLLTPSARAGPVFWSATVFAKPDRILSDQGDIAGIEVIGKGASAPLSGNSSLAFALRPFASANAPAPFFTFSNQAFGLVVGLKDMDSGAEEALTFNGEFFGTLTPDGTDLIATFSSPLTQHLRLGENDYTVSLLDPETGALSYVPPGPPGESAAFGRFTARVEVLPGGELPPVEPLPIDPAPNAAPEPSALLLAAAGLLPAVVLWRRRRKE